MCDFFKNEDFVDELSLYDTDSRDSGFSEGAPAHFEELLTSPILFNDQPGLENDEICVSFSFSPKASTETSIANDCTPVRSRQAFLRKKRRSVRYPSSYDVASPSQEAALSFKRMRIFTRHTKGNEAENDLIKAAVEKSSEDADLIGDFTKAYCLPLTESSHPDVKSVSPRTVKHAMEGHFSDVLSSCKIVDCRYPYEFDGGHIQGAVNVYTKEECLEFLNEDKSDEELRNILIFHCEFSKERGPNMYRFLRKEDRLKNEENYPKLDFPEMYVLKGGYKKFFEEFPEMTSGSYKQMHHPGHEEDLKYFRHKSKTWNDDVNKKENGKSLKRVKSMLE